MRRLSQYRWKIVTEYFLEINLCCIFFRYGFVLPARYIDSTAKEAMAALRVIADAAYLA